MSAEGFREKKGIPAGRPGRDEDIAQLVLALAVDTYINGQVRTTAVVVALAEKLRPYFPRS